MGGKIETIQTTALLKPEYLEDSKRPEEICCHSSLNEKPSVKTGVKTRNEGNNNQKQY